MFNPIAYVKWDTFSDDIDSSYEINSKLFVKLSYKLFCVHKKYVWIIIKVFGSAG